jgi:hypothetical protein
LALLRHADGRGECLFIEADRKSPAYGQKAEFDPEQTFVGVPPGPEKRS